MHFMTYAWQALDIVRGKLSKKMRRNLILIAKLLQNLSNGLEFGEKVHPNAFELYHNLTMVSGALYDRL